MIGRTSLLDALAITTAVSAQVTGAFTDMLQAKHLAIEANFTYGSGGTDVTAWVQTSFDGGTNWIDIAAFNFTTSSARKVVSLNAANSVTTVYTPLDGTLSDNTVKDGLIGDRLRVKYTTTGTYAGSTTLDINVVPKA